MRRGAKRRRALRVNVLSTVLLTLARLATAADPAPADPMVDPVTLGRIRDAAMTSDWAWEHLALLTDRIGPRLSGSTQLAAAVTQVASALRTLGARVELQPVSVPHWVRGAEAAELVEYPDRPEGITQPLHVTALGGSGATPPGGLTGRVVIVHDFAELDARAVEIPGCVVLFESRFDQRLADNGHADAAYELAARYRFGGPARAAALGAAAALVRSVGGADYRLPHTGATGWQPGQVPIPAGALAAEDADLLERLSRSGPIRLRLLLTPRTLPDAPGQNVIADWPGRERPGEYVIVSGHLDSWDLGTGAIDDGAGVISAAAVIEVLRRLDLHPRRTIRFIAWTNEENGGRGAKAYFTSVAGQLETQVAAIESDSGAGRTFGIGAAVGPESMRLLRPLSAALAPIGAPLLRREEGELGADIAPLQAAGVPGFAPLVDARHYFDYHHTAADTLDKVDPESLRTQVAAMAVLAFYLAELPSALPHSEPPPRGY